MSEDSPVVPPETPPTPRAFRFDVGQFPEVSLKSIPTWYLKHVLADATGDGVKWASLTAEQQLLVREEVRLREGILEGAIAVPPLRPGNDQTAPEDRPPAEGEPTPTPATAAVDITPGVIVTVNSKEAIELVATVSSIEHLDKLQADEEASERHEGGRKGVLDAIEKRRAELLDTPEERAALVVGGTVAEAVAAIEEVESTSELDAIESAEKAGKSRTGILEAIEKRRAALSETEPPA